MRFARYSAHGEIAYGVVEGQVVRQITGTPFEAYRVTDHSHRLAEVRLLAPCTPSKVLCMAVNYVSHAGVVPGTGAPNMPTQPEPFLKAPTTIIGPEEPIVIPRIYEGRVDEEGEVVVVIGKRCKRVSKEDALSYVLGYTCGNDVSARQWQSGDRQWWRGKSSDTFAPIGPFIVTELDHANITFRIRVNGKEIREGNTKDLAYDIPTIISFISQVMTLEPGDVIFTGTPGRPAEIKAGDTVEMEAAGVGVLRNPVRAEE